MVNRTLRRRRPKVARYFASFKQHRSHSLGINREDARERGVVIRNLEDDHELQDAILSVHHSTLHTFGGHAVKIVENHLGKAWVVQIAQKIQIPVVQRPVPQQPGQASPPTGIPIPPGLVGPPPPQGQRRAGPPSAFDTTSTPARSSSKWMCVSSVNDAGACRRRRLTARTLRVAAATIETAVSLCGAERGFPRVPPACGQPLSIPRSKIRIVRGPVQNCLSRKREGRMGRFHVATAPDRRIVLGQAGPRRHLIEARPRSRTRLRSPLRCRTEARPSRSRSVRACHAPGRRSRRRGRTPRWRPPAGAESPDLS